jgi:hypothetical protein
MKNEEAHQLQVSDIKYIYKVIHIKCLMRKCDDVKGKQVGILDPVHGQYIDT